MADFTENIVFNNELKQKGYKEALDTTKKLNKEMAEYLDNVDFLDDYLKALTDRFKKLDAAAKNFNTFGQKKTIPTKLKFSAKDGSILSFQKDPTVDDYQAAQTMSTHRALMRKKSESIEKDIKQKELNIKNYYRLLENTEEELRIRAQEADEKKARRDMSRKYIDGYYIQSLNKQQELKLAAGPEALHYKEAMARRMDLRTDNPELFMPFSQTKRYLWGSKLRNAGSKVNSLGPVGQLAGSALNVAGSFILNPINGLATMLSEAIAAVGKFTRATLSASAEIESLKTNLGIVFGDQTQAESMFQDISQYAVKSPFGVEQTTEMAVLLKQSGVYASDLMDTLKMIGDTAGGNADKMKRIANNYAQITSIGKASMLDMRQFAYAGIPIYKAVSEELGVSQEHLRKMISQGEITSDIIETVFKKLTGVNGLFENATEKGSKTLKARIQNLKDAQQLFLASYGDAFLQKGIQEKYNKSGVVVSVIDMLEKFFSEGQISKNIANINKNVESIESFNNRLSFLKEGLEDAKKSGDKKRIKLFEEALTNELSKRLISEEKATYLSSFNAKQGLLDSIPDIYKGKTLKELYALRDRYTFENYGEHLTIGKEIAEAYGISGGRSSLINKNLVTLDSISMLANGEVLNNLEPYMQDMKKEVLKAITALEAIEDFTEEEIQAHAEDIIKTDQQQSITLIDKAASKKGSLLSEISSLTIALSETESAKKKEQEDQRKRWDDALDTLRSIDHAISDSGIVDIAKLSAKELLDISKKGGFRVESERIVSYDEKYLKLSDKEKDELKKSLVKDFLHLYNEMLSVAALTSSKGFTNLTYNIRDWGSKDDEQWFNEFTEVYKSFKAVIENSDLSQESKDDWGTLLGYATSIISSVKTDGLDTKALDEAKLANKEQIVPLWKRIESSALGIPVEALKGTKANIDAFMDSYSSKDISSKVFGAIGNVGIQQKLLKYYGVGKKDGDKVYQIDWKETLKSVKEFALSLDASVEVINAYKTGLEDQRKTLMDLATSGIYTMENQGTETLYKTDAEGNQLKGTKLTDLGSLDSVAIVNAFGEKLVNKLGDELKLVEGEIVDSKGNKYEEADVIVTGNIYESLIKALKDNSAELNEASTALRKANLKRELNEETLFTNLMYGSRENLTGLDLRTIGFVEGKSPNYIEDAFKSLLAGAIDSETKFSRTKTSSELEKLIARGINSVPQGELQSIASINSLGLIKRADTESDKNSFVLKGSVDSIIQGILDNPLSDQSLAAISLFNQALREAADLAKEAASQESQQKAKDYLNDLSKDPIISSTLSLGSFKGVKTIADSISSTGILGLQLESMGMPKELAELDSIKEHRGLFDNDFSKNIDKQLIWAEGLRKALEEAYNSLSDIAALAAKDTFLAPFEAMGKALMDAGTFSDDLTGSLADIGKTVLKQIGPLMAQCGLQIAASAAAAGKWSMVFAGLGLAAAGGVFTGIGAALDEQQDESKKGDEQYEKAQDIKDQLAALLEQARKDALYYELNLRHKKALGLNKDFSLTSVNDAIISPSGDIVTTHPEDYLIATKTPGRLLGGNSNPNITFKVINNSSGVTVRQEQRKNELGETELIAIVENIVTDYIAGPRGDNAFDARQARKYGKTSVM